MKTKFFTIVPALVFGAMCFGQAPQILSVDIVPPYPTPLDTIHIITTVSTRQNGVYLGNDVYHHGKSLRIEGCYFNDSPTSEESVYTDTINIGVKNQGSYTLTYEAYRSGHDMICNEHLDSSEFVTTFSVGYVSIDETSESVPLQVFPNPSYDGMVYLRIEDPTEVLNYKVYNALGEIVSEGTAGSSGAIDLSPFHGMLYLQIQKGDMIINRKVQVINNVGNL